MTPSPEPSSILLRLSGRDALPLLHRISTQALEDLGRGESRATLFCDFRARLLFRVHVLRLADDSVWLLHENAPGAAFAQHLDRHVFREDVRLEDWSDRFVVRGRIESGVRAGSPPVEAEGRPWHLTVGDGAVLDVVPATTALVPEQLFTWEVARIASGRPRHGHEIAEAFHPFEVGLGDEVHLSKGCYTGQEVLQRLVTYHSVRRQLARIAGAGIAPATPVLACVGEERVGTITTAIAAGNGWTGLAVLSARAFEPGAQVRVEDGATMTVTPFPPRQPRGLPTSHRIGRGA